MMQHTLNLLSPEQKEYLRYERNYLYIRTVTVITLSFIIGISCLLLSARFVLQSHYDESLTTANVLVAKNGTLDKDINRLNMTLGNARKVQQDFIKWSGILTSTSQVIPARVDLNYINFDSTSETLSLIGVAQTRDDLLQLKSNLSALTFMTDLTSPLDNLTLREHVKFELSGKLKATPEVTP